MLAQVWWPLLPIGVAAATLVLMVRERLGVVAVDTLVLQQQLLTWEELHGEPTITCTGVHQYWCGAG